MAYLEAAGIARVAIELLTRSLVLPMTVARVPGQDFSGPNGASITVRVPQPRSALQQETPGATITLSDIDETPVTLTVEHWYDGTAVTDEDLSLSIEDFGRQVTQPQAAAVATAGEDQLVDVMNGLTAETVTVDIGGGNVEEVVLAARAQLSTADVPAGNRFLAVSPGFANYLLALDKFSRADATASTSALRDAVLGRIYGFTVVESNGLTAGTAVAYHSSGLVFASRAPVTPQGASSSATSQIAGVGLRQIFAYNPTILSDISVVSTFSGAALVEAERVLKVETAAA